MQRKIISQTYVIERVFPEYLNKKYEVAYADYGVSLTYKFKNAHNFETIDACKKWIRRYYSKNKSRYDYTNIRFNIISRKLIEETSLVAY